MRRGQATIELLILLGVAVAMTAFIVFAARSDGASYAARIAKAIPGHQPQRRDDRWALRSDSYGPLLRRNGLGMWRTLKRRRSSSTPWLLLDWMRHGSADVTS